MRFHPLQARRWRELVNLASPSSPLMHRAAIEPCTAPQPKGPRAACCKGWVVLAGGPNNHQESALAVAPLAVAATDPLIFGAWPLAAAFLAATFGTVNALALGFGTSAAFVEVNQLLMLGFATGSTELAGALAPCVGACTGCGRYRCFRLWWWSWCWCWSYWWSLGWSWNSCWRSRWCWNTDGVWDGVETAAGATTGPGAAAGGSSTVASPPSVGRTGSIRSTTMSSVTLSTSLHHYIGLIPQHVDPLASSDCTQLCMNLTSERGMDGMFPSGWITTWRLSLNTVRFPQSYGWLLRHTSKCISSEHQMTWWCPLQRDAHCAWSPVDLIVALSCQGQHFFSWQWQTFQHCMVRCQGF